MIVYSDTENRNFEILKDDVHVIAFWTDATDWNVVCKINEVTYDIEPDTDANTFPNFPESIKLIAKTIGMTEFSPFDVIFS
jgi:hypothetical protein